MNELQLHCCECLSVLVLYYSYDFTVNIPPMDCYYFMYEVNVLFPFLTGLYACISVKIFTITIKDLSETVHDCLANCSNLGKTVCLCP